MKLIDKDAVVAEIERRMDELYKILPDASKVENGAITISDAINTSKYTALESFGKFISTLEVKEVDINKEVNEHWDKWAKEDGFHSIDFAKHFFALGMAVSNKAQKDNIRHSMDETPNYPCDILFVTDVDNMFLFKYMENGRPVDRGTPYFHNIQNGKCWYYCNDIINIH